MAVGIAGLFIETHQDPDNAPSDGPNMVPLAQFGALMRDLDRLLEKILLAAMSITHADGGTLYTLTEDARHLRFLFQAQRPSRRIDRPSTLQSCPAPASTTPASSHSMPGR